MVTYPREDMTSLREVLSLLTVLWALFRRHLKVELTILFNDVILRVLRSPHAPPEYKVEVLKQLNPNGQPATAAAALLSGCD